MLRTLWMALLGGCLFPTPTNQVNCEQLSVDQGCAEALFASADACLESACGDATNSGGLSDWQICVMQACEDDTDEATCDDLLDGVDEDCLDDAGL